MGTHHKGKGEGILSKRGRNNGVLLLEKGNSFQILQSTNGLACAAKERFPLFKGRKPESISYSKRRHATLWRFGIIDVKASLWTKHPKYSHTKKSKQRHITSDHKSGKVVLVSFTLES
ncbi:hypothetical protein KP509_13G043500 [Ceratopteris richardii]|uniref:Uncharacterized protein n=1 Tax=Ceratopteris richardii TaxID=49495 RepID=A0A8T2TIB6_CERRI|nr:hypothetical protein KP509_13G043500 [Ceratopteris richardii]